MEERLLKASSMFPYHNNSLLLPFLCHAASSVQHTTNCVLKLYLALMQHLFVELLAHSGLHKSAMCEVHVSTVTLSIPIVHQTIYLHMCNNSKQMQNTCILRNVCVGALDAHIIHTAGQEAE